MRKTIVILILTYVVCLWACEDEISGTYSTKYPVRFYYEVAGSPELYNAIGNPGQFVRVRPISGKIRIANTLDSTDYSLSQVGYSEFEFGLGGLIIGTSSTLNMSGGYDLVAYDLACPNCDRQSYRLNVKDNGTALCSHCGNSYDLNNYGWIISVTDDSKQYRALYRYRISYNGIAVNINNH